MEIQLELDLFSNEQPKKDRRNLMKSVTPHSDRPRPGVPCGDELLEDALDWIDEEEKAIYQLKYFYDHANH